MSLDFYTIEYILKYQSKKRVTYPFRSYINMSNTVTKDAQIIVTFKGKQKNHQKFKKQN